MHNWSYKGQKYIIMYFINHIIRLYPDAEGT